MRRLSPLASLAAPLCACALAFSLGCDSGGGGPISGLPDGGTPFNTADATGGGGSDAVKGSDAAVTDPGVTTPPTDTGGTTPPTDAGGTTPPTDAGGITPPTDAGGITPPTDAGGITPPTDAGGTNPPTGGAVGAGCAADTECGGTAAVCLDMQGGYCALSGCAGGANPCPAGSACYTFDDGADSYCIQTCTASSECREAEGYVCDADDTCWPGTTTTPTGTTPIGGPCAADSDCKDAGASCYPEQGSTGPTGFVKGYCMIWGCTDASCPAGASCLTVTSGGDTACFASCAGGAACPQTAGYACSAQSETCWPGCSGDGDCPAGYGCKADDDFCVLGWTNEPFACDDQSFEPNDNLGASALVEAPLAQAGVDLCSGDLDWYRINAPAGKLVTVGATFPHVMGDLDMLAYNESGAFLGARLNAESYGATYRKFENDVEFLSMLNMTAPIQGYFKVQGFSGATNTYELQVRETDWIDDLNCADHFTFDECRGYNGTVKGKLYNFPFARPDDPFVPGGYSLESYGNYRWLRRETIMVVRYAIHQVQERFGVATDPIGLIDMCQIDGITPGYDIGDPRHPETTHDQGGNIDIAYYQTDGDSSGDVVCGPNGSDHDGYFCTSTANHVMDVERQAYFMAMLNMHPRLRVIGIDKMLAPLVIAELAVQRDKGWISASLHDKTVATMAYGDGWPFHHHHIHLSMYWWSQDAVMNNGLVLPLPEPPVGCGYRLPGDGPLP